MEFLVRGTDRNPVGVLDNFISAVWREHYNEAGDFEILTKPTEALLTLLAKDNYLCIERSDKWMIIESRQMIYDPDEGYRLLVKGRSLESLLDRRIILQEEIIDNDQVEDGLYFCITRNMIDSPGQPQRNFPNFRFVVSSDPDIRIPRMSAKYIHREYVYDIVTYWTQPNNMGWRIHWNPSDNWFDFKLYLGTDRSHAQTFRPIVIFSPSFDNLLHSEWVDSYRYYKDYALVMGDNTDGPAHVVESKPSPDPSGLSRRELFVDATDVSKFYAGSSTELPISQYLDILYKIGDRRRATINSPLSTFMGKIYSDVVFRYNEDFFLGDIVAMNDGEGHSGSVRVVEYTFGQELDGEYSYPTFEPVF
jgi:hypothetical protein